MIEYDRVASIVGCSNATILEVGANQGQDTQKLIDKFRFGHLFAFEPDPRAVVRFRNNISDPRVHLFEMAIGAEVGFIEFYQSCGEVPIPDKDRIAQGLPDEWDLSGSIRKPKLVTTVHPWLKFDSTIKVPITTLDAWTRETSLGLVDFIWADVQGAEADLIRGAHETLNRTRWFYTEFCDIELYDGSLGLNGIASLLPDFEINEIFENDVLFENKRLKSLYR